MQQFQNNEIKIKDFPPLIPVARWDEYFPDPSVAALRWAIFKNTDGFNDACVVRRGKRILIDVANYHRWLKANQTK